MKISARGMHTNDKEITGEECCFPLNLSSKLYQFFPDAYGHILVCHYVNEMGGKLKGYTVKCIPCHFINIILDHNFLNAPYATKSP